MSNEFEISRATGKCAQSGQPFVEGQVYYAVLFERPEGFERLDYSEEAWTGPPEGAFCYWKARVPVRERKPTTIAVDSSVLVQLFCRLEDATSEMKQRIRFVLALLLMRKRLLKFEKAVRDGEHEYWQMRLVSEQSVHQVLNPELTPEQVERLNVQLMAILSGDVQAITSLEEDVPDSDMVLGGSGASAAQNSPGEPTTESQDPSQHSAPADAVAVTCEHEDGDETN